ncbi:MAG: GNAT family N-acetyltransferase [Luminiphilus sp.]|nr:GNAT family N-acetyltransferase [Luminiphilus sp.]
MAHDPTVRLARPDDIEHLAELFDHYRQFYDCPPDHDAAKRWLTINLAEARSTIFVADTGLKLLGFTQLYPALCSVDLVKYYVLYDLFVAEAERRRGIARSLMNTASEWATTEGAARIDLETARDNTSGQSLYRSLGYEVDEVFLKFSLDLSEHGATRATP